MDDAFKDCSIDETIKKLSSRNNGLSEKEASERLEKYGYNEIIGKQRNYYLLFLKKFYGSVQLLLWAIVAISLVLKHYDDFYIILILLVFNALIGFFEEYRADRSVDALKAMLAKISTVKRSGKMTQLQSRLIVPGDIVHFKLGEIIPADLKLIDADMLQIDESILTGEALPVQKQKGALAYSGSTVKKGEGTGIVIGTGYNTFYGRTAKLVENAKPKSHLEAAIMNIVKYLVVGDIIVIAIMFAYGILEVHESIAILLPFLLVMFIASVPVALSAAFTVSMALGTEKLAKKSVLVTKLEAIEDTSNMNVICMDKTGTITKNEISVKEIFSLKYKNNEVLQFASEASRADDNDPIDNAIINYVKPMEVKTGRQLNFMPFDPSSKRTEALVSSGKKRYYVTKGAAHVIMGMCAIDKVARSKLQAKVEKFASEGFRTLAIATRASPRSKWAFMGLLALYDIPRPDAKDLIDELKALGVSAKMITGDNIAVANEIAHEVDLHGGIIDIRAKDNKNESMLSKRIIKAGGFADVYPEDKYTIVKALQKSGHIVGMTGDGVNDAPALKQAEVGIAVSSATDVAKSAASLVLTKNGIEVIVDAVKESRRIFQRMATYAMVKVVKVFQIIGFIATVFVLFKFIPITPFLLILLIFTNDIVNIALSTDNEMYSKKPNAWRIRPIIISSAIMGIILMVEALVLVPLGLGIFKFTVPEFQTAAFLMFNIGDNLTVYNIRSKARFWDSRPSTPLVLSSILGMGIGIAFAAYGLLMKSISGYAIISIIGVAIAFMFLMDIVKTHLFKRFGLD